MNIDLMFFLIGLAILFVSIPAVTRGISRHQDGQPWVAMAFTGLFGIGFGGGAALLGAVGIVVRTIYG